MKKISLVFEELLYRYENFPFHYAELILQFIPLNRQIKFKKFN